MTLREYKFFQAFFGTALAIIAFPSINLMMGNGFHITEFESGGICAYFILKFQSALFFAVNGKCEP